MADISAIPLTASIKSDAEARYLVRMSGLPVFLAGCACFFGLLLLDTGTQVAVVSIAGGVLIALGLILRSGRAWAVVPAVLLTLGSLFWTLWQIAPLLGLAVASLQILNPVVFILFAGFALQVGVVVILALSGLRGWIWLRRRG